jgi:ABC-2 type transport system ATP-binding protein
MLACENVSKSYGRVHAVSGVTLTAAPGQVTGLLGPNGAGKTTLIRMVTAYLTPSAGRVTVGGHDTVDDSARARACIGYLPEANPLYPEMPVTAYLRYRAALYGVRAGRARTAAVARVVGRCWLGEVAGRRIGELSKGYKQRVGLAAALLHDPPLLVLDEPSSGLDPGQVREMRELIREVGSTKTVLVSSHVLPEVEQTVDRVVIVARGRVRADGTPEQLVERHTRRGWVVRFAPGTDGAVARGVGAGGGGTGAVEGLADGEFHVALAPGERPETDLTLDIARAAHHAGLLIVGLRLDRPTLEQVFIKVVMEEAEGGKAA